MQKVNHVCIKLSSGTRNLSPSFVHVGSEDWCRSSDFFQDWWAEVIHGAKNGGSFSDGPKHIKLTIVDIWVVYFTYTLTQGAQWLSGRVLDSRPKGRGFEPHRRHCIVSLSKNINSSFSTGSTQEAPSLYN